MQRLKVGKIALARLRDELNAGRPVMLIPLDAKLEPPTTGAVMVPVAGIQPQFSADRLQIDICGDSGLILVEVKQGGR
jgi:hypothetical protein